METDQTNWNYLRNISDEEAHANALADPDAQPITEDDIKSGRVKFTKAVTVPLDYSTLDYFRSSTPDYPTAMAKILHDYAASHRL